MGMLLWQVLLMWPLVLLLQLLHLGPLLHGIMRSGIQAVPAGTYLLLHLVMGVPQ
jgi:hypothetical protein